MATFFYRDSIIRRSKGQSVIAAAAYQAGEKLRDPETNRTHDYSKRNDVFWKDIILPEQGQITRSQLWTMATEAEKRKNSRLARRAVIALPVELPTQQQITLVQDFANQIAQQYKIAVDIACHTPNGTSKDNYHAHLLLTTRKVITRDGKITLGNKVRDLDKAEFYKWMRETWLNTLNKYLDTPINFRSNKTTPKRPYLPEGLYHLQRRRQANLENIHCDPKRLTPQELAEITPTEQELAVINITPQEIKKVLQSQYQQPQHTTQTLPKTQQRKKTRNIDWGER